MNAQSEVVSAHIQESTLLQPAIQAWKLYLRDQGRSHHTLKAFTADLALLESFLPTDKTIRKITTKDLEDYLGWLEKDRDVPCSPKTLSRRITSIKSFFRWLVKGGVLNFDPAEKVLQKTVISPLPTVLTPSEYSRALDAADALRTAANPDPRPYTLMMLVLETAMKKGECLSLMTNHLEIEKPEQARATAIRNAKSPCPRNGRRPIRNISPPTKFRTRFFPGLSAASNIFWRMLAKLPSWINTFRSTCVDGQAR